MLNNSLLQLESIGDQYVVTRTGFDVQVFDEYGELLSLIVSPHPIKGSQYIWSDEYSFNHKEIDLAFNQWLVNLLTKYLNLNASLTAVKQLAEIFNNQHCYAFDPSTCLETQFVEYAFDLALDLSKERSCKNAKAPLKRLYEYCLLNEVKGFNFEYYYTIDDFAVHGKNINSNVLQLDPVKGPFSVSEMSLIQGVISNENVPISVRVIFSLAKEFGLRPMQMSLLRECDFYKKEYSEQYYLKIPRVKNRTEFYRESFTIRIISTDELSNLIKELIEHNKINYPDIGDSPRPLIFRTVFDKNHRLLKSESEYFYHISIFAFSNRINTILNELDIISPRTGDRLEISIYRFRYTLATNAVLNGKTKAEVAALLDHSTTESVKHYFKLTYELGDYLDDLIDENQEQKSFILAWEIEQSKGEGIYNDDIIEPKSLACLGGCSKSSGCDFEPAVACYGCDSFFPSMDSEVHVIALQTIQDRLVELKALSTGHIPSQLMSSKIGALAAIEFSARNDSNEL